MILIPALFLLSGAILAHYAQKVYVAPVLMYHQVIPDAPLKDPLTVTVISFERQMAFLKKQRYNVVSLEALADLVRAKKKIPPRTLAISFDDGCIDNYTNAFPVLKKYRLPATMFIIVGEAGRERGYKMNWEQLKEMRASGLITIGCHAFSAEPLVNIKSAAELKKEIFESKRILEEKLGGRVDAFSYPEGRFNSTIRQMVIDAGYRLAVATNPGKKFAGDDVFALKRLRISSVCDDLFVFGVEISGLYTFMRESRRK